MGITNDNKLDFFDFEIQQHGTLEDELWIKGIADVEGFFTLENAIVPKVLTATSLSEFEIKGNIILRWIPG